MKILSIKSINESDLTPLPKWNGFQEPENYNTIVQKRTSEYLTKGTEVLNYEIKDSDNISEINVSQNESFQKPSYYMPNHLDGNVALNEQVCATKMPVDGNPNFNQLEIMLKNEDLFLGSRPEVTIMPCEKERGIFIVSKAYLSSAKVLDIKSLNLTEGVNPITLEEPRGLTDGAFFNYGSKIILSGKNPKYYVISITSDE